MAKQITLSLNASEARNIEHGLNLLFNRITDQLQSVDRFDSKGQQLKDYYKEKRNEVHNQLQSFIELNKNSITNG